MPSVGHLTTPEPIARGASARPRRWCDAWAPVCAPAAVALAICTFRIGSRQLWRDEHATWLATFMSWDALLRLLSVVDAVLAPYYVMLRGFVAIFGDSEAALRFPSALAMAASAGLLAMIGRRLFGARVGLYAGLFFACMPNVSRFAQEARPYALAMFFVTLSTCLLLRALDEPTRPGRWFAYGACVIGIALTHLVALIVLSAHCAWWMKTAYTWRSTRARLGTAGTWPFTVLASLALVSPFVFIARQQSGQVSWLQRSNPTFAALPEALFLDERVGVAVILLAGGALVRRDPRRWFLGLWALVPPVLLIGTHATLHLFHPRYILFSLPAWVLLATLMVDDVARWLRIAIQPAALLLFVSLCFTPQIGLRRSSQGYDFGHREAARWISDRSQPADAVAFGGERGGLDWSRIATKYEWRRKSVARDVFLDAPDGELSEFRGSECEDPARCLPADARRIWLVTTSPEHDLFLGMPAARANLLRGQYEVQETKGFRRLRIALLVRKTVVSSQPG